MDEHEVIPERMIQGAFAGLGDNANTQTTTEVETDLEETDQQTETTDNGDEVDDQNSGAGSENTGLYYDEEEGREVFLKAVDPETGESSVYLDREQAAEGLKRQLAFIGKLKAEQDKLKTELTAKVDEAESELSVYRRQITPQQARESLIKERMPAEMQKIDDYRNLTDEEEIRAYRTARIDAELGVDRDIAKIREDQKQQRETQTRNKLEAETHVASRIHDLRFFGLRNSEDKFYLESELTAPKDNNLSVAQVATLIAENFGKDAADTYLKGQSLSFNRGSAVEQKKVEKTLESVTTRPVERRTPPVVQNTSQGKSARDIISSGFSFK